MSGSYSARQVFCPTDGLYQLPMPSSTATCRIGDESQCRRSDTTAGVPGHLDSGHRPRRSSMPPRASQPTGARGPRLHVECPKPSGTAASVQRAEKPRDDWSSEHGPWRGVGLIVRDSLGCFRVPAVAGPRSTYRQQQSRRCSCPVELFRHRESCSSGPRRPIPQLCSRWDRSAVRGATAGPSAARTGNASRG